MGARYSDCSSVEGGDELDLSLSYTLFSLEFIFGLSK